MRKKIIVIGGGPAGMMAAIRAAQLGCEVILLEKNPALGRKLLLSGKGRCNLTNFCDLDSFLRRFSHQGDFLRSAFKKFFNQDIIDFFQRRGLRLKIERQNRVFPATDCAESVVEVLKKELSKNKVKIIYRCGLFRPIIKENSVKGVLLKDGQFLPADALILATGGISYSFTGSSGYGINLARRLGHKIIPLRPGLVPLKTRQRYPLEGLTLKNIRLKFSNSETKIISGIGELLFTQDGISGPLVLSLSAKVVDWLEEKKPVYVEIDLKPALSKEELDVRLLREFSLQPKKSLKVILKNLLPKRLIKLFLEISDINPLRKANQITRKERESLISLMKSWRLDITGARPIEEAMVTRGGVCLKQIDPRTMESRLIKGLYFAGEMIDIDADTGGFNLQAAFSTGYLAGESSALKPGDTLPISRKGLPNDLMNK
ncbi:MAG: NAD(P)/FAD-dependent oxidoreductase [Candidatus Omnitrophica bacterium]|nr:NAD(P)/FAD-dependent oxidoreductase [Candidatus Omnitrophota bacterium]